MYLKIGKGLPKWSNYELAIGRAKKEDPIPIATFLTVIGDEALDVFNAFMCDSDEDKVKMDKVIMSIIVSLVRIQFTRVVYSFRVGRIVESIDKYATVTRNMAASCEF